MDTDAEEAKLREVYESGFTDIFRREKGISPQEKMLKQSYNGQKSLKVKKKVTTRNDDDGDDDDE